MSNIENILKLEGVNAKGFGICSHSAMCDVKLSLTAKAIYAYLCSYLGSGEAVFPKRETILSDLNISKNGYYAHFNSLIKYGYIKVQKMSGYLNRNIYVICNELINCDDFEDRVVASETLSVSGINKSGYGFIPKLVMTDNRIDVKAKGLIAYLYTISAAGTAVFPTRKEIWLALNLKRDAYYRALNQLINYNYITVEQRKNSKGKFIANNYILNLNPDTDSTVKRKSIFLSDTPCTQKKDNLKNSPRPCTKNEDNTCTKNEDNNNSTTINNTNINISINHKDNINSEVNEVNYSDDDFWNIQSNGLPYAKPAYWYTSAIKELAMYDEVISSSGSKSCKKLYMLCTKALIEMCTQSKPQKYRSSSVSSQNVIDYLNLCITEDDTQLSIRDYLYEVIQNYQHIADTKKINNPINYLKACLWTHMVNFDC